jgi:hypothetical protein
MHPKFWPRCRARISRGHAFTDSDGARFGLPNTCEGQEQLATAIEGTINVGDELPLPRERIAYFSYEYAGRDPSDGLIVIIDPNNPDGGTAFPGSEQTFRTLR